MWKRCKKSEIDDLKNRIEVLEARVGDQKYPEYPPEHCVECGYGVIETTSLGARNRTFMCPKCGREYGVRYMETR